MFNSDWQGKLELGTPEYILNMFNLDNVYEELLENILFAQCKVLESYWTINTLKNTNYLNYGIENLGYESNLINFYNDLYGKLLLDIINNYHDVYSLRREFYINRYRPLSSDELLWAVDFLKTKDEHLPFNSQLNKNNIHKKIFPYS